MIPHLWLLRCVLQVYDGAVETEEARLDVARGLRLDPRPRLSREGGGAEGQESDGDGGGAHRWTLPIKLVSSNLSGRRAVSMLPGIAAIIQGTNGRFAR